MNSHMVTYDLIKRKDYPELFKVLQSYNYWHCLGSSWIIKTDETAAQCLTASAPTSMTMTSY
jgi:hypothetical protein